MYIHYPHIDARTIVFVAQGRIFLLEEGQKSAVCLVHNHFVCVGPFRDPKINIKRQCVFFVGHTPKGSKEIFCCNLRTGVCSQITYDSADNVMIMGLMQDDHLWFSSSKEQPFGLSGLYTYHIDTQEVRCLEESYTPWGWPLDTQKRVIQRYGYGAHGWKGYQGGTAAQLWIAPHDTHTTSNTETRIDSHTVHNILSPTVRGSTIYALKENAQHKYALYAYDSCLQASAADHQGTCIYEHSHDIHSYTLDAQSHRWGFVSHGSLYTADTIDDTPQEVSIRVHAAIEAPLTEEYLPHDARPCALAAESKSLVICHKGSSLLGHVHQRHGMVWSKTPNLPMGARMACFVDEHTILYVVGSLQGDQLYTYNTLTQNVHHLDTMRHQRIRRLYPHPKKHVCVLLTHDHHYIVCEINIKNNSIKKHKIAQGLRHGSTSASWSSCGRYFAYSITRSPTVQGIDIFAYHDTHEHQNSSDKDTSSIKPTWTTKPITPDHIHAHSPCFGERGTLYFLIDSRQWTSMDPVRMAVGFEEKTRVGFCTLNDDIIPDHEEIASIFSEDPLSQEKTPSDSDDKSKAPSWTVEHIQPVGVLHIPTHHYHALDIHPKGLILARPNDENSWTLYTVAWGKEHKIDLWGDDILGWTHSKERKKTLIHKKSGFSWCSWAEKIEDETYSVSGAAISYNTKSAYKHMLQEALSLQNWLFWNPESLATDDIWAHYENIIQKACVYQDFVHILTSMQGELQTSHAYVMPPFQHQKPGGYLLAQGTYEKDRGWIISHMLEGHGDIPESASPLLTAGYGIRTNDSITHIKGQAITQTRDVQSLCYEQGDQPITVRIRKKTPSHPKTLSISIVLPKKRQEADYIHWVNNNKKYVKEHSDNRLGYVHIPDMGEYGYKRFFQDYEHVWDAAGLIIDVRFNRGGFTSPLLLDVLRRKRSGYDRSRLDGDIPHPIESPRGPMVALCNGYTGSDGDIFCHEFQRLGLGRVIGTRTWGGVVGIMPRYPLLDGTMTTQPEFAIHFFDVGTDIENKGVTPDDIVLDHTITGYTTLSAGITSLLHPKIC